MLRVIVKLNSRSNRWFRSWFPGPDARAAYEERLGRALGSARFAVHLGAGARDPASVARVDLQAVKILAVDCSTPSLARNPNPWRVAAWASRVPLRGGVADVVFSEYLMEHVTNPREVVAESFRLLRPGGTLLWVAPNLWSYQGLITHLTPLGFHRWVARRLESTTTRRAEHDVFPTYFRINSARRIRRILGEAGFRVEEIYAASGMPHYTQFIPVVHQLAILVHAVLDRLEFLSHLRMAHVVRATKPAEPVR